LGALNVHHRQALRRLDSDIEMEPHDEAPGFALATKGFYTVV
jgi:hypothetical protein